jgi:hypothetical protein
VGDRTANRGIRRVPALIALLTIVSPTLIASSGTSATMAPFALVLLGVALVAMAAICHVTPGTVGLLTGLAARSVTVYGGESLRQRDPDASGHVRPRAPGMG